MSKVSMKADARTMNTDAQPMALVDDMSHAGGASLRVDVDADGDGVDVDDDERRRAERAGVTVRIDYATVDEMFSEFTRDINEGGVFIETEKPHQPGTEVTMQFNLPGASDVLRTIGRVVRVSSGGVGMPAGMGIEFDELTNEDRVKIDLIVRSLRSPTGD